MAFLRVVRFLVVDVDTDDKTGYLRFLSAILHEIGIMPSHITETVKGFHIVFTLLYPCKSDKFGMAEETQARLIECLGGDPSQPRLNILTRLPEEPTNIFHSDPNLKISCGAVLKSLKRKTASSGLAEPLRCSEHGPVLMKSIEPFQNGVRNWSIYHLSRICKQYRRDISWSTNLMETLSPDTPSRELQDTVRSAYRCKYYVSNATIQRFCLGNSVSDTARRYGISQFNPYERKLTDEELDQLRRKNLLSLNDGRQTRTMEILRQAVRELEEQGSPVTRTKLHKVTGIHHKTIEKYRGIIWDLD